MELYHVFNRGVDGRKIFLDDGDQVRFVHGLYHFNNAIPANNTNRLMNDFVSRSLAQEGRKRIINIHGWCLMKNHYHLLISERAEGGLVQFIRKLNIGYAKFFNEKYRRTGTLFQGRTKKVLIERDAHFLYILHYIHLNPLDYLKGAERWRVRNKSGVKSTKEALEYLDSYRWSSYQDYAGEKNFPSILTTSLFKGALGNYPRALTEYLRDAESDFDPHLQLE